MHFQNFIYPASSFLRIVEKLQLFYTFSKCMIQSRITDSSSGGTKFSAIILYYYKKNKSVFDHHEYSQFQTKRLPVIRSMALA